MCFGTSNAVKKAEAERLEIARKQQQEAAVALEAQKQAEADRELNIRNGETAINVAYADLNDDYYKRYKDAILGASMPGLDRQYSEAKDTAFAQLAGRGVLDSSYGNQVLGGIERQYGDSKTDVASQAADASNLLRQKVDSSKAGMFAMNTGSTDPSTLASQAYGSATSLAQIQPQQVQQNGTFSAFLTPLLNYASERSRQITPVAANNPFGGSSGSTGRKAVSYVR